MTLPENINEDLAGLLGWKETFRGKVISDWFNGDRWSNGCPDMTTPDAMVELMEFCNGRGWIVALMNILDEPRPWACSITRMNGPGFGKGYGETPAEAVALAVHALKDGGPLLTNRADFPEHLRLRQLPWTLTTKEGG